MSGFTANNGGGNSNGQMWDLINLMADPGRFQENLKNFAEQENAANAVIQKSGAAYEQSVLAKEAADNACAQVVVANEQLKNERAAFEAACVHREQAFARQDERFAQRESALKEYADSVFAASDKLAGTVRP